MNTPRYSYTIEPRPNNAGGGWHLRLLDDEVEIDGGAFPVPNSTLDDVRAWWTELGEEGRAYWRAMAHSPDPVKAYRAFLLAEAHAEAEAKGNSWLDSLDE